MTSPTHATIKYGADPWPALPFAQWKDTCETLHMWMQIVGKIRLALTPLVNHWWEVPFYVTSRGLTTSPIPYEHGNFEMEFDFIEHLLRIETSNGATETLELEPRTVANFYREVMETVRGMGVTVDIWDMPVEVPNPIRFNQDTAHAAYDRTYAHRFWQVLVAIDPIFKEFRGRFIGKCSPVHFFWGSFDLCVTRFSGRRAPERPGADAVTREAYSHEVCSVGWWPGGADVTDAAFYCYAAPEPAGYREAKVSPAKAYYSVPGGGFRWMYEDARNSADPRAALLEFCQSTYDPAANLAKWDRANLERQP
ncbi:MAG: DUF5996 family protein [Candidatus Acidiferrales bacterium]|jgi:uncharacterized protein DUF5996